MNFDDNTELVMNTEELDDSEKQKLIDNNNKEHLENFSNVDNEVKGIDENNKNETEIRVDRSSNFLTDIPVVKKSNMLVTELNNHIEEKDKILEILRSSNSDLQMKIVKASTEYDGIIQRMDQRHKEDDEASLSLKVKEIEKEIQVSNAEVENYKRSIDTLKNKLEFKQNLERTINMENILKQEMIKNKEIKKEMESLNRHNIVQIKAINSYDKENRFTEKLDILKSEIKSVKGSLKDFQEKYTKQDKYIKYTHEKLSSLENSIKKLTIAKVEIRKSFTKENLKEILLILDEYKLRIKEKKKVLQNLAKQNEEKLNSYVFMNKKVESDFKENDKKNELKRLIRYNNNYENKIENIENKNTKIIINRNGDISHIYPNVSAKLRDSQHEVGTNDAGVEDRKPKMFSKNPNRKEIEMREEEIKNVEDEEDSDDIDEINDSNLPEKVENKDFYKDKYNNYNKNNSDPNELKEENQTNQSKSINKSRLNPVENKKAKFLYKMGTKTSKIKGKNKEIINIISSSSLKEQTFRNLILKKDSSLKIPENCETFVKNKKISKNISVIKKSSNVNQLLRLTDVIELSLNLISKLNNEEISKAKNINIYISMNLPTIYEQIIETANYSILVNCCPINYVITTIDKINQLFNLNNEIGSNQILKRHKSNSSGLAGKEIPFSTTNLNSINYQPTLNNISHLSNILEMPNDAVGVSKPAKYTSNKTLSNTLRLSSKEIIFEEDNKFGIYKKSSNSIKLSNINNNALPTDFINTRKNLNKINESEDIDENKILNEKILKIKSLNNSPKVNKPIAFRKKKKENKGIEYGESLRRKILNFKKKETRNSCQFVRPFELFDYKFLDQFGFESRKKRENSIQEKNSAKKIKKKNKNSFSINLKEIIKLERKEGTHRRIPSTNKENGIRKSERSKLHLKNKSCDFKDSVDKYLRIDNSLYNSASYVKKKKKNNMKVYGSPKRDDKYNNDYNKILIEKNLSIEISNNTILDNLIIDNNQSSDITYLSQETITNNFKLLNKNLNGY